MFFRNIIENSFCRKSYSITKIGNRFINQWLYSVINQHLSTRTFIQNVSKKSYRTLTQRRELALFFVLLLSAVVIDSICNCLLLRSAFLVSQKMPKLMVIAIKIKIIFIFLKYSLYQHSDVLFYFFCCSLFLFLLLSFKKKLTVKIPYSILAFIGQGYSF